MESIIVRCNYFESNLGHPVAAVYTCDVQNKLNITSPDTTIYFDNNPHQSGKNNDNVEGFYSSSSFQITQYFPHGLNKVFKNLKIIDINNGRIKEIHQSDLRPFKKLEVLDLDSNDIQVIETGLFDFNPNLVIIWLSSKILHIDAGVFTNLKKLAYLYLGNNLCINRDATASTSAVQTLSQEAYAKCQDSIFSDLNQKLKNLEMESKPLNFDSAINYNQNLTKLETVIKNSKFSYLSSFKRRIECLKKSRIHNYMYKIKSSNGGMDTFKEKIKVAISKSSSNNDSDPQSTIDDLKNQLTTPQTVTFSNSNEKIEYSDNTLKAFLDEIKRKSEPTTTMATTFSGFFLRVPSF